MAFNTSSSITSQSFSVMIVDDHAITREGFKAVFRQIPGYQVCAEASNGPQLLEKIKEANPDILVLDLQMPSLDGASALKKIRETGLKCKLIIMTRGTDSASLLMILKHRPEALILKTGDLEDIHSALRALQNNRAYFSPEVTHILAESAEGSQDVGKTLSKREKEVAQLVAQSLTHKEIAKLLKCSEHTVKTHKTNAMRKLGVSGSSELAVRIMREEL